MTAIVFKVSMTLLSIVALLDSLDSSAGLRSPGFFSRFFGTVLVRLNVTFMFHSFFSLLARSRYLLIFSFPLSGLLERQNLRDGKFFLSFFFFFFFFFVN